MKYHYLGETIYYSALVDDADKDSYTYVWEFDDGESLVGDYVGKIWNSLGNHSVVFTATDKESGYKITETIHVCIVMSGFSDYRTAFSNNISIQVNISMKKVFMQLTGSTDRYITTHLEVKFV